MNRHLKPVALAALVLPLTACSFLGERSSSSEGTGAATVTVTAAPSQSSSEQPSATTKPSATTAKPAITKPTATATPTGPKVPPAKAYPVPGTKFVVKMPSNWEVTRPMGRVGTGKMYAILFQEKRTGAVTGVFVTTQLESSAAAVCGSLTRSILEDMPKGREVDPQSMSLGGNLDGMMCGATGAITNPKSVAKHLVGKPVDQQYSVVQATSTSDSTKGLLVFQRNTFPVGKADDLTGASAAYFFNDAVAQLQTLVK